MFKPVSPKLDVIQMEEKILNYWKDHDVFHQSMRIREGVNEYVFYEGPPTANGKPGVHHVLARAFKDIFPRYKTMQGYHVSRRGGWDTHGLPVEIEVEKKLGLKNKRQIEEFGIAKFNELCRESAFTYIKDWEKLTDRIGYWVDLDTAYITYKNEYIESIWSILKNFWDRNLLYQGYKVVPYCPRCGTPLSDHEVALGYKETSDPSIFVRMRLLEDPGTSLLVWTTTPWTLPANVAVAAGEEVDYVTIERNLPDGSKERLILAEALLDKVFADEKVKVLKTSKGKELKGMKYEPLFSYLPVTKSAHYVILGDFVTTEDGTGLVHIAPAFGADDMAVSQEYDLPVISTVAPDGSFINEVTDWAGVFVKDADPQITKQLQERGLLFKEQQYVHTYPFCWRCSTPLLYYARPTWYIRTSQFKQRLVEINERINWYPEHIKKGRLEIGWLTILIGLWGVNDIGAHLARLGMRIVPDSNLYRFR
jgi:isoleucyl-tRNA synthetase